MCYARVAAMATNAVCKEMFSDEDMASTWFNGHWADAFDVVGHGSHKYIPADRLTEELGMPQGAGVYSYWKMADGSYVLRTCPGRLAYWSGKEDEKAQWPEIKKVG